jgi:2-succinyl-5-enolpyruvyl-6-hydroxy-3-cyclohexene-1-carboxylate synthase
MNQPSTSSACDSQALATANILRAAVLMGVLQRAGVRLCVVSPGSRSAPLVLAAARTAGLELWVAIDERSAGFIALGHARRSGRPVALLCTSGSAPAHYFPTMIEASEAGIPLIVLTADRPPELRNCAAGQTIDQIELFGKYARQFVECSLSDSPSTDSLCDLRNLVAAALVAATGNHPGPIHLNIPFREPLVPAAEDPVLSDSAWLAQRLAPVLDALPQVPAVDALTGKDAGPRVPAEWVAGKRGLILVGAHPAVGGEASFADAVLALSHWLGWPVLTDAASPMRYHPKSYGQVVAHYDVLLRDTAIADSCQPDVVLQFGALPTAKVLRQWLSGLTVETVIVDPRPRNLDPLQRPHQRWFTTAQALAAAEAAAAVKRTDCGWNDRWQRMDSAATNALAVACEAHLKSPETFCEPLWPQVLVHALEGITCDLHFASSMPVRDAEWLMPVAAIHGAGFSNRGANGIDGTLSTAIGAAHRSNRPMVLVCGDLAFLHDANALLSSRQLCGSLTVVLIDNGGGRIFESLPIVQHRADFETFFATPQQVDFASLAAAHGIAFSDLQADTAITQIRESVCSNGLKILRLQSDNPLAIKTRRDCFAAMQAAATVQLNSVKQ